MIDRLPIHPFGLHVSLTWPQVAGLFDAIEHFKVGLFVEIGLYHGGLAAMMAGRQRYMSGFKYLGVELNHQAVDTRVINEQIKCGGEFIFADAFLDEAIEKVKQRVVMAQDSCLIFCDNGNKPAEVKLYAPLLRAGDLISVHDYGTEVQPEDLDFLSGGFEEIDRERYREALKMPLFEKL